MIKVGITGNIGSGKSQVTNYLLSIGYKVVDFDKIVSQIYQDQEYKDELIKLFGKELGKKEIAKIVFNDQIMLDALNKTIEPFIQKYTQMQILKYAQTEQIIFLDIPLLFEKEMQNSLDYVILVYCKDILRFERASKRDKKTIEQIRKIDSYQMNQNEKLKLADFVIENQETIDILNKKIQEVVKLIFDKSQI